ncbi:hypothetical protein ACFXG4_51710 [Nocardia sp. NPDC059246]|uniref:hypothetical protein n=1 Tax=unclassified Nocardia TaxID=2637762 RepID=UPI003694D8CE
MKPADHAIGRSRGGLATKVVAVPRFGGGPPCQNPDVVIAHRAYSAASSRTLLRRKRIQTIIPERSDQVANRKRKGRHGGRALRFDPELHKRRNVIERAFNTHLAGSTAIERQSS